VIGAEKLRNTNNKNIKIPKGINVDRNEIDRLYTRMVEGELHLMKNESNQRHLTEKTAGLS